MSSELALAILLVLLVLNLLVMLLYRHDKVMAKRGGRRVSESSLLLAAFFAPFGAVIGMRRFHHKTRHVKFLLVYLFMLLQLLVIVYSLYLVL